MIEVIQLHFVTESTGIFDMIAMEANLGKKVNPKYSYV